MPGSKIHLFIIFGTRPEIIKLAPLIEKLQNHERFTVTTCSTGQHKDLVQSVLDMFDLEIDINLNIMKEKQTLNSISSSIYSKLPMILETIKPDALLVQGDTTSSMISAMIAFNAKIKVIHIEAGLRTYQSNPFPEERNRRIISCITDIHFAPTEKNHDNFYTVLSN